MESNDGDNILLNLTTEQPYSVAIIKKTKSRQSDSTKKPRHVKLTQGSAKCKNVHKNKVSEDANSEKFQVISSLFRKNPKLPDISSAVIQSEDKKEDGTFSGSEFRNMNLAPFMISNLEKNLHLKKMTSVQKASLPSLLSGKDVFIKSPTGTGKTLAYVIPVVQSLQDILPKIQRIDGPYCLILVPTRELASQTLTVIQQVLKPFIWIVPGCVTGGEKRKSEKARLRKGVNILVATPGRLVDHLKTTQCLTMAQLKWLILDEADRLLDLGFEQDISFILSTIKEHTSRKVQKVLLSATLSRGVENLLDVSMENPVTIDLTKEGNSEREQVEYQTPSLLEQFCVVVPMKLRLVTLAAFLQRKYLKNCKIIVFFTTQDSVDFHFVLYSSTLTTVEGDKLKFLKLHGKLSQHERTEVFSNFKDSDQGILLCTDVAARGLDLPSVNWIVQYNPPVSSTDYVHRVGRTARIGMSGQALLFLLPTEVPYLNILSEQNLRY
ncbi:probable ATP-dependent RNA helicase DDX31 [Paramuricea clavata]|uniref:ATP-dependent RNA helicase n=1 Tax=Paramuricea clavata TaxID=317549 RepID=A0A7D9EZ66_PARCT|nr:probable ATP-dependent RNA helicase DDX31 [Paramuricea clavata]